MELQTFEAMPRFGRSHYLKLYRMAKQRMYDFVSGRKAGNPYFEIKTCRIHKRCPRRGTKVHSRRNVKFILVYVKLSVEQKEVWHGRPKI